MSGKLCFAQHFSGRSAATSGSRSISANAEHRDRNPSPLCAMPRADRRQQGWQSHRPWWRSQRPPKEGGGQQHRPYRVCDSCGAWIYQNRIGANPICNCRQPWIAVRDELGDGFLWPQPDKIPGFKPEPAARTIADQWKCKVEALLQQHWDHLPEDLREAVQPNLELMEVDKQAATSP